MANYKIDAGVPLPQPNGRQRGALVKALRRLLPTDSVLVPLNGHDERAIRTRVSSSITYVRLQTGWRFLSRARTIQFDGEAGIRIWRLHDDPPANEDNPSRAEDVDGGAADQRPIPEPRARGPKHGTPPVRQRTRAMNPNAPFLRDA